MFEILEVSNYECRPTFWRNLYVTLVRLYQSTRHLISEDSNFCPSFRYTSPQTILQIFLYCLPHVDIPVGVRTNPLMPDSYYGQHQVLHFKILLSVCTVYLCVLYGSQNKERLFPDATLTCFCNRDVMCLLRGTKLICAYD
jgi:hypothetical protein